MYQKPALVRLGTFRQLTQVGCTGGSDNQTFLGATTIGSTLVGAGTFCLAPNSSR